MLKHTTQSIHLWIILIRIIIHCKLHCNPTFTNLNNFRRSEWRTIVVHIENFDLHQSRPLFCRGSKIIGCYSQYVSIDNFPILNMICLKIVLFCWNKEVSTKFNIGFDKSVIFYSKRRIKISTNDTVAHFCIITKIFVHCRYLWWETNFSNYFTGNIFNLL